VAAVLLATVLVAAVLLGAFAPSVGALNGMGDLGPVVDAGQPLARGLALAAAAMTVGHLLVAAAYRPGDPHGPVTTDGYRALQAARGWAALQVVAALAAVLFTVAENTAIPPAMLLTHPDVLAGAAAVLAPAAGWLTTAGVAAIVAAGAGLALSWRSAAGLLVLALAGITPMTLTTSTDADRSHDIVGDALTLHTLASVVWLGSALAVTLHLARRAGRSAEVLRRHGYVVTGCLLIVGYSGPATLTVTLPPRAVFTSAYGLLVVGSVVVGLTAVAVQARLRAPGRGAGGALAWVAVEAGLLTVAVALGTGLTRLYPPAEQGYTTTRLVYLIGYELPGHLTVLDLVTRWRWDVVLGVLAVVAALGYLVAVWRLRRRGRTWPGGRTAAWLAGCAVLLVATSSGLGAYAPAVFSVHMVQHMLLATLVPVLLVLGHGVTLTLQVAGPGVAARLESVLDAPAMRLVRHPAIALTGVAATLFLLYPTGLYAAILQEHWAHLGMDVAFLGTGLALYWPVLGRSLPVGGLPAAGRIVMVFAVMGLHAAFAAWLLARATPVADAFYASLRLPYIPDLLADQRRGAVLGWVLGEVPTVIAVAALVTGWAKADRDDQPGWLLSGRSAAMVAGSPRSRPPRSSGRTAAT
jgi:putative copper resistance protein D